MYGYYPHQETKREVAKILIKKQLISVGLLLVLFTRSIGLYTYNAIFTIVEAMLTCKS